MFNSKMIGTNSAGSTGYEVGDFVEGGVVYYTTETYALIVALDYATPFSRSWGCRGTAITGTTSAVGGGATSTANILAQCATRPILASDCAAYNGGGFTDWYLPTSGDLITINRQVGNDTANYSGLGNLANINQDYYMSSTQYSVSANSCEQIGMFNNSTQYVITDKNNTSGALPVRTVFF